MDGNTLNLDFDAIIIGAGMSGMYQLYKLLRGVTKNKKLIFVEVQ